ncbi:MAG TPA: hypothetical protein VL495_05675 [Edaphobacter sp.]|nr:hypothetical protein [Edaphobacter sp.]
MAATVAAEDCEADLGSIHEDDPRWLLAQRIAASKSFARSSLLSNFLLYVCSKTLSGRTEEISEQQIGVYVFGRKPQYNPAEDNIVRNYARQLRHRLDSYFEEEGSSEPLRVFIPRGTYVPSFIEPKAVESLPVASGVVPPAPPAVPPPVETTVRSRPLKAYAFWAALLLVAIAAPLVLWRTTPHVHAESDSSHILWTQIFNSQPTFVVPADDGIVMFQNLTGHSVHLADYISRSYLSVTGPYHIDHQNMEDLDAQRYTSVADLDAVLRFSRLQEAQPDHVLVRYARELHMDDLKDANAILLGSSYSNPWVELFQKNLNFEFSYEPKPNDSHITNRHPLVGESPVYANDADTPSHRTYAVVALVPNLNNTGWVLLVEGLTMAGTQAGVDTLFNRSAMQPILQKARLPNGTLRPFEVLIETRSFGSSAPQANVVASRLY